MKAYRATRDLVPFHATHQDYPLLAGDVLIRHENGTWDKVAPGLRINGFALTEADEATLTAVEYREHPGLVFTVEVLS